MERFSNNYQDLIDQVKQELLTVHLNGKEKVVVNYLQIPSFPDGHFSVFLIVNPEDNQFRIVRNRWDNEYDIERFSSRVYNLDRLCIKSESFDLSPDQQETMTNIINSIEKLPDTLERQDCIVLDGINYELILKTDRFDKKYEWKIPTEDICYFETLIKFLVNTEI